MLEQRRPAGQVEVGLVGGDVHPVGRVEERRGDVAPQRCHRVGGEHGGQQRGEGENSEEGGQQSSGAVDVEALEVQATGLLDLGQDDGRDQEAAEDEEHVDAQETAGHPGDISVVQQDGQDGDGPNTVETGDVSESAATVPGLRIVGYRLRRERCRRCAAVRRRYVDRGH